MSQNNHSSKSAVVSSHAVPSETKKQKKSSRTPATKTPTAAHSVAPATTTAPQTSPSAAEVPAAVAVSPASPSPAPAAAITILAPPPPLSTIPAVPSGTQPIGGADYRALVPRALEVTALPGAVNDLQRCTDFSQMFGVSGLSYALVLEAFEVAAQWTAMRKQTGAWNAYCTTEEGVAWTAVRSFMQVLKPLYVAAVRANPSIARTYPGLAALFGAQNVIAQKGASTRKNNKKADAKGEPADHGVVGKRRARVAAKALLAAQQEAAPAAPAAGAATPVVATPTNGATHS